MKKLKDIAPEKEIQKYVMSTTLYYSFNTDTNDINLSFTLPISLDLKPELNISTQDNTKICLEINKKISEYMNELISSKQINDIINKLKANNKNKDPEILRNSLQEIFKIFIEQYLDNIIENISQMEVHF